MTIDEQIESFRPLLFGVLKHNYPAFINDEDAIQLGFIGIWRGIETYKPGAGYSLKNWVILHIKSKLRNYIKYCKNNLITESNEKREIPLSTIEFGFQDEDGEQVDIEDLSIVPFDEVMIEKEEIAQMKKYHDKLSEREKIILEEVYNGKSFNEIGKMFGVTRERIRQIYNKIERNYIKFERDIVEQY